MDVIKDPQKRLDDLISLGPHAIITQLREHSHILLLKYSLFMLDFYIHKYMHFIK